MSGPFFEFGDKYLSPLLKTSNFEKLTFASKMLLMLLDIDSTSSRAIVLLNILLFGLFISVVMILASGETNEAF